MKCMKGGNSCVSTGSNHKTFKNTCLLLQQKKSIVTISNCQHSSPMPDTAKPRRMKVDVFLCIATTFLTADGCFFRPPPLPPPTTTPSPPGNFSNKSVFSFSQSSLSLFSLVLDFKFIVYLFLTVCRKVRIIKGYYDGVFSMYS